MILKGSQRRGANDLALHLSNAVDNETVNITQMRGMVADNLYDGFREWALICSQTKAKDPFYSLSINPDPGQREWKDEEWQKAIGYIETRLGLSDQPRAVVFHEKYGADGQPRKHCHVVWSRIRRDGEQLKAVHMGNDYYILKSCARDLAKEFELELSYGETKAEDRAFDHAQSHGKNRDVETSQQRKETLTKLWHNTKTPEAFHVAALSSGYVVAQGQRRTFVVVDRDGQTHALARQIDGVKTKDVKARLGNPEHYPDVDAAKEEQRLHKEQDISPTPKRSDLTKEQRQMQKLRRMAQRADVLAGTRRAKLDRLEAELNSHHTAECTALREKQKQEETSALRRREQKRPTGFMRKVCDAIGISKVLAWLDRQEDQKRLDKFDAQTQALTLYQDAERKRHQTRSEKLHQQERREAQSINRLARKLGAEKNLPAIKKQQADSLDINTKSLRFA